MKSLTTAFFLSAFATIAPQAQADLLGDQIEIEISVPNLSGFNET